MINPCDYISDRFPSHAVVQIARTSEVAQQLAVEARRDFDVQKTFVSTARMAELDRMRGEKIYIGAKMPPERSSKCVQRSPVHAVADWFRQLLVPQGGRMPPMARGGL